MPTERHGRRQVGCICLPCFPLLWEAVNARDMTEVIRLSSSGEASVDEALLHVAKPGGFLQVG